MRELTIDVLDAQLAEQLPAREPMGHSCSPGAHGYTNVVGSYNGNGDGNGFLNVLSGNLDGDLDGNSVAIL